MFTCSNRNEIVSDEGFSVEILGRIGLCYREGEKCLRIDSEVLGSPYGLVVYQSSIKTWAEPEGEAIADDEKKRILANVRNALAFQGHEVEVI